MNSTIQSAGSTLTLPELLEVAELGPEAEALYQPGQGHRRYVAALVGGEEYAAAVLFLAHALPRREAIWWAWSCAREASGEEPPPAVRAALDATQQWITEPNDANGRAAFEAAEALGAGTPAGSAALAVFLSGESLAPPGVDSVPPGPFGGAKALAGSIILSAVAEPAAAAVRFRESITKALELATRLRLWMDGGEAEVVLPPIPAPRGAKRRPPSRKGR
jgi:hypothetical protein